MEPNSHAFRFVCCPCSECLPINIYQMSLPSSSKSVQKLHLFHETYVSFWQLVFEKKQVKLQFFFRNLTALDWSQEKQS